MKRTDNLQINSRAYWNSVYGNQEKRDQYASQGTSEPVNGQSGVQTTRFTTALDEVKSGDKVVDMGCGVGVFTKMVKGQYPDCEVWGTDISDQACTDNTLENPSIKYLHQYIGNQTELPDNYFDMVFSGETLEHLDDPNYLFKDAYRVLKTGGKFVLTTPNGSSIRSPEHTFEFTHEDVEQLYIDNGFKKPRFIYLPDMEHLLVIMAVGVKQ